MLQALYGPAVPGLRSEAAITQAPALPQAARDTVVQHMHYGTIV
ncbi:hypothetical protein ACWGI9_31710 [Streptomyces sp. NPDC054833]